MPPAPHSDFSSMPPVCANSSHVFNISLWTRGFCQRRLPCDSWTLPSVLGDSSGCLYRSQPRACRESVMARLSAGPSPVIRRVNTMSGPDLETSRSERRGVPPGSCPAWGVALACQSERCCPLKCQLKMNLYNEISHKSIQLLKVRQNVFSDSFTLVASTYFSPGC